MPDQRTVLAAKLTLASRFSKTMAGLDVKVRSVLQPLDGCCSPSRRNRPSRSELLGQEARPGADPFSGDGPIEDDILLRALEGDTEAASALQERQQQRRQKLKEQAAAAPASARRPPVALAHGSEMYLFMVSFCTVKNMAFSAPSAGPKSPA